MSLDKPPPQRYRVEEKNGRLIVIDLKTGVSTGGGAAPAQTRPQAGPTGRTPSSPARGDGPGLLTRNPFTPRGERTPGSNGRAARAAIVIIAALMSVAFMFVSSTWIFFVLAMFVPKIRAAVLPPLWNAIVRFVEGKPQ